MRGVAKIKGPVNPKVGEECFYEVVEYHKGTVVIHPENIQWKIFKKKDGAWVEAKGNLKMGKKVSFTFSQRSYGQELLVEAYLFEPEMKAPPGMMVRPVLGPKKILNTEILDANGGSITAPSKYGQTITLKVTTENMLGETLKLSLWDRDTISDTGHDPSNNTLLWEGNSKIVDHKGISTTKVVLSANMLVKANKSMFDGSEHEYYLLVDAGKMRTISATTQVSGEVMLSAPYPKRPEPKPLVPPKPKPNILDQVPVKVKNAMGFDEPKVDGVSKAVVEDPNAPKVEGIITAYFAKEEFTKETDETAGQHKYTFANDNNNIDKDKIAGIIKKKVDAAVKADKKYAKLHFIKATLTETSYKKGATITFDLHKLGATFKKINSAPLEEEVYVVANTYLLNGKEATITIKEKEALLVAADADLTVLEAKENGAEITTLKATVEDGVAKVKIKLRPKSDEDLKTWKEKLSNGKEDGTHKYQVERGFTVEGDLDAIAASIERKSNKALTNHIVKKADISKELREGASYTTSKVFEFAKYKKELPVENLWLKVVCTGSKKYEGDYLKRDGEYFVLGKGKEIIFPLLVKPENDTENKWGKSFYWAASQGGNQAAFNSNRAKGKRKHAGRDLYTLPETPVVAICKGEVLEVKSFYAQTDQVTILHETNDGRKFIIRYGELAPNSITVKKGDIVTQKQQIGVTGFLVGITVISGETVYMIHFEHYTGEKGYDLTTPLSTNDEPFMRRTDLVDSITILQEGYKNTFGEDTGEQLFTVEDGKEAITELYNKYKDQTWSWKWEGSAEAIQVSGKDLITIVEKMYRLETAHFTSKQYQNCGTGGMESFGSAPYYGWDSSLFTEQPVGIWSAFEGKGLSGQGGNAQVTTKQKEFVKLPSVLVGMEYKAKYIIKYEGNYARWYNTNTDAQEKYRESLKGVKARFVESL
jgi:murein DD-endopeptidase MepM/ murein hydrolase activator NlpD